MNTVITLLSDALTGLGRLAAVASAQGAGHLTVQSREYTSEALAYAPKSLATARMLARYGTGRTH